MNISPDVLGRTLPPRTLRVTTRQALAYAAGCGEARPEFLDDTRPGFSAPPTQCVAQEFHFIAEGDAIRALGIGRGRSPVGFHAYQDSRFQQPIRVGEELRLGAVVCGLKGTGAGCLVTYRFEASRSTDNSAVYRSLASILLRGVGPDSGEVGTWEWPAGPGGRGEPVAFDFAFPANAAHIYSECSGVWQPMHTEMSAARRAGLERPIMQGVASWAITARELRDAIPAIHDRPLDGIRRLRGRFRAPVVAGTPLRLEGWVHPVSGETLAVVFEVRDAGGGRAIEGGYLEFDLTNRGNERNAS